MDLIFAVGWEGFIIPGIAFVIWVISSLAGGNKNAPPNAGAKNLGPGNRAPLSDLERFFQEAKQRRTKPDPVPMASLVVESTAPKVKQRPIKNAVKRNKVESSANPFLIDQITSALEVPAIPEQGSLIKKVVNQAEVSPPSLAITKDSKRKFASKTSPLIAEALALLKGPKVIGSALVLQEILQPPLCMRRRPFR